MLRQPTQIIMIGRALHGRKWRNALARDLGVHDRTVRRWASGKAAPPKDLRDRLCQLVSKRIEQLYSVLRAEE